MQRARAIIGLALGDHLQHLYDDTTTALELWAALERHYAERSSQQQVSIMHQLMAFSWQAGSSGTEHVMRLKRIADQREQPPPFVQLLMIALNGMPGEL